MEPDDGCVENLIRPNVKVFSVLCESDALRNEVSSLVHDAAYGSFLRDDRKSLKLALHFNASIFLQKSCSTIMY